MLNKVIIYGIGNSFKEYFEDADFIESGILTNGMDVVGVCDGNREYFVGGGTEVTIGSKKYIVQDISEFEHTTIDFILITSKRYFNEIKEDLVDKGIDGGKICLLIDFVWYKLFQESTYKYKLSLVLIIRDEAEYIKEWIEYHRLAGAEHFYIYDDESSDGLCDRIKDYTEKGLLHIFHGQMQIKEGLINTLFKILNGTASIWDLLMRMSLLFLLNKKCFRML